MAIVHLAIFDAVNAIEGEYKSYTGVGHAPFGMSMKAAIAQAAHDTLVALFPSQTPSFADQLADDLTEIPDGRLKTNGVALGRRTAAAILTARANDGSQRPESRVGIEFLTSNEPGKWRQDPISVIPLALGAYWGEVKPFALETSEQFRIPQPPRLDSPEYTAAFNEVKAVGGDGVVTPTTRTAEQTLIGTYWAYDGTPSLCAPPRLYNQITMRIAHKMGTDTNALELARLVRPVVERSFSSLSQAEEENGQSRIYLGIHWVFDKTEGIAQGRRVADYVFKHAMQPRHQRGDGR
jgi:hypothetical protein